MNESLQQALAGILNKTMAGVEAGVSFLSAELPDVIHQLLLWKMAQSLLLSFGGLLLIAASLVLAYKQSRLVKKPEGEFGYRANLTFDGDGDIHPGVVVLGVGTAAGLLFGFAGLTNLDWLQIWLAPKIYLIEYAASLAK
jgi:hypothetical protein